MQYLCFKQWRQPLVLKPRRSRRVEGRSRRCKRRGPSFERAVGAPRSFQGTRMAREMVRQGGRSARIQEAVHAATQALLNEVGRGEINVPMIAERAGVTPSTVYRRWGDLAQLLADTAAERLRPDRRPGRHGLACGRPARLRPAICGGNGLARRPGADARRAGRDRFRSRRRALLRLHDPSSANPQQPRSRAWRGRFIGRRSDRHPDRADLLPDSVRERRDLAGLCEWAAGALRAAESARIPFHRRPIRHR